MHRREAHQVSFSEPKQTHSRRQTSAVLWMQGMFESLLKMNERAGGLDQPLEKICVMRVGVQPKLLKHIVRLVIAHFVPTTEKRDVKRMLSDISAGSRVRWSRLALKPARGRTVYSFPPKLGQPLRNPLAFVNGELNLLPSQ